VSRHAPGARVSPAGLAQDNGLHPLGGLGALLDLDGDGNPLDGVLSIAGRLLR
jgi:hypothetical protein